MQTSNRVLDDLAKVANGAVSTLVGIKAELEALMRQQFERLVDRMDLVSREEFDAVKAMAAKGRAEQEKLGQRLAELEARLAGGARPSGAGKKKTRAPRARRRS